MKRYRHISLTFAALIVAFAPAYAQQPYNPYNIMNSIRTRHNDLIMLAAHRGVHALWGSNQYTTTPENSLEAIDNAVKAGIEIVEVDVRLTQDGVPILSHDSTWGRNTDVGWGWGACASKTGCFNPWGPLPGLSVPDGDPGELGGGVDSPSDPQRAVNPNVSDWSLYSVQQAPAQRDSSVHGIYLRNSLNFQLSAWGENPPTLQNALDFIRSNKYNVVLALDIKDANAMNAAWQVVARNLDYHGYSYAYTTFIKFDAAWVFPSYDKFQAAFSGHALGSNPDYSYMNIMPVFQTSSIQPGLYGSEGNMQYEAEIYAQQPYTVGIEMNAKQLYGIGSGVSIIISQQYKVALANFNPYAEWINPNDQYGTYQFFYSNGYCCGVPRNWFYNGAPYNQPSDTDDQRLSWPFLFSEGWGFNFITTDNVLPMNTYLASQGYRNTSYLY